MLSRQLADGLQVSGLGEHDPEVHHRRLHDHAGGRAPLVDQPLDPTLHRAGVVERDRDRELRDRVRDAGAVRDRLVVLPVAELRRDRPDRDHHPVVMAVVGAGDLHDRVAPGEPTRDPDRVHRRLRPGVDVAPLREPPAAGELLAHDDGVLRGRREMGSELDAGVDRVRDRGVGMALHHRAEPVVEVEHLVPVDVPDPGALAVGQVERPRMTHLVGGGDAAGERPSRPLVHRPRALRPPVEPLRLPLDQLLDPLPVDRHMLPRRHVVAPSLCRIGLFVRIRVGCEASSARASVTPTRGRALHRA